MSINFETLVIISITLWIITYMRFFILCKIGNDTFCIFCIRDIDYMEINIVGVLNILSIIALYLFKFKFWYMFFICSLYIISGEITLLICNGPGFIYKTIKKIKDKKLEKKKKEGK